ncbi:hypothetical protein Pelo_8860 [Pelomyxa schiedti]|nr:hypothetical protein Pelo_8860 [Pelomyxa schiedti]
MGEFELRNYRLLTDKVLLIEDYTVVQKLGNAPRVDYPRDLTFNFLSDQKVDEILINCCYNILDFIGVILKWDNSDQIYQVSTPGHKKTYALRIGKSLLNHTLEAGTVVAVKHATIIGSEANDKLRISTPSMCIEATAPPSFIFVNPEMEEATKLRQWYIQTENRQKLHEETLASSGTCEELTEHIIQQAPPATTFSSGSSIVIPINSSSPATDNNRTSPENQNTATTKPIAAGTKRKPTNSAGSTSVSTTNSSRTLPAKGEHPEPPQPKRARADKHLKHGEESDRLNLQAHPNHTSEVNNNNKNCTTEQDNSAKAHHHSKQYHHHRKQSQAAVRPRNQNAGPLNTHSSNPIVKCIKPDYTEGHREANDDSTRMVTKSNPNPKGNDSGSSGTHKPKQGHKAARAHDHKSTHQTGSTHHQRS